MTIISFALFLSAYQAVTKDVIEPYYYEGLIFAPPAVCFGIVSLLSVKNIIKAEASSLLTISLIIFLGIVMVAAFTYMIIGSLAISTTDVSSYERVLNLSNLPDKLYKNTFPDKMECYH